MAQGERRGPAIHIRYLGRMINLVATHAPWAWRVLRRPVRGWFDSMAQGWDKRIQAYGGERIAPIDAGLQHVESAPRSILDIGTGTGVAALMLADSYPDADVLGIDLSEAMIDKARKNALERGSNVRFAAADVLDFDSRASFDLITMLNMPPFYDTVVRLLAPGGYVIHASSAGARTPFYTPPRRVARAFARRGVERVATETTDMSTWFVGQRFAN